MRFRGSPRYSKYRDSATSSNVYPGICIACVNMSIDGVQKNMTSGRVFQLDQESPGPSKMLASISYVDVVLVYVVVSLLRDAGFLIKFLWPKKENTSLIQPFEKMPPLDEDVGVKSKRASGCDGGATCNWNGQEIYLLPGPRHKA